MEEKQLILRLKEAYTVENLNKITTQVLELFKHKKFDQLNKLLRSALPEDETVPDNPRKLLSRLMLLYHPDRLSHYLNEIKNCEQTGALEPCKALTHIFYVLETDFSIVEECITEDELSDTEYQWETDVPNNSMFETDEWDMEDNLFNDFVPNSKDYSFYAILKRRYYGDQNIELPYFLLEDIDELEFVESNIHSLDGIEHCKHLVRLNISSNQLVDISDLQSLIFLEELYLSDNKIGIVDALSYLPKLRVLDISNNEVDDISQLFNLEALQYVNVMGNQIPNDQIERLKENNIVVIY